MTAGEFSRVKEKFVASFLESDDRGYAGGEGKKAKQKEAQPSPIKSVVEGEITLVFGCDSLLRVFRVSHWQLVIEESYKGMPRGQDDKKKRERDMDKEPVMQPAMKSGLEIEQAPLLTPALDLFYPVIIRGAHPQSDTAKSIGGELAVSEPEPVSTPGLEIGQDLVLKEGDQG